MESALILTAAGLSGAVAVLDFITKCRRRGRIAARLLWSLATVLICVAVGCMVSHLAAGRFVYSYVYNHTDRGLSALYKISALWSGQEGSFLLWSALSTFTGLFLIWRKQTCRPVIGIYAIINTFILCLCYFSHPFAQLGTVPSDGLGMAEALKDPWMAVHPPLVFIAYSCMAVLAAHCAGDSGASGSSGTGIRVWTLLSWAFLGLGIFTGCVWAYRALGWGGYWAWDPIENAALVPWLILCGNLHLKVKPGPMACVLPFAAACLGTFLTRSGILEDQSAHAYTGGSLVVSAGLLILLILVIGGPALARAWEMKRGKGHPTGGGPVRSVAGSPTPGHIVYAFAGIIFLGTMAPLILGGDTPALYYVIAGILFAVVYTILLLAADLDGLRSKYLGTMGVGTVLTAGAVLVARTVCFGWLALLWVCMMPLALWLVSGFKNQGWAYYLRHMGMVLMIAGAILSTGLSRQQYVISSPDTGSVTVEGISIPVSDILDQETLIRTTWAGDVIIQGEDTLQMSDGSRMIPYITKPMIYIFWLGGVMVILLPCMAALIEAMDIKRKREPACMDNGKLQA